MQNKINFHISDKFIHYYLGETYLGMLTYKGELSDFRAIIRKNRWTLLNENIYKQARIGLFELLNQYLIEAKFMDTELLQKTKDKLVRESDSDLKAMEQTIINNNYLR